jgi:spore maturation protein CgeB
MMKVLFVGSDHVWSLERFYRKYFLEADTGVELFPAQNMFYEYHGRSIFNKIKLRANVAGIFRTINHRLKDKIESYRPDIIWVFKGMEVLPETLRWISSIGIPVVNYNPDNPFIFTGAGSGNRNVSDSIPLYDLHFTYNLEIKKRLETEYRLRTAFLPFGFELSAADYSANSREPEIVKACFVGNPDEQRVAVIKELAAAGLSMDIYGNDWQKFLGDQRKLTLYPAVYKNEFWKALRKYRLQLNIMRVHNEDSHNMRTFEVPGAGGIMLAPATTEHKLFFVPNEEVFLFENVRDCLAQAGRVLDMSRQNADAVRENARKRSLESGYSYRNRALQALDQLKSMYEKAGGHPL